MSTNSPSPAEISLLRQSPSATRVRMPNLVRVGDVIAVPVTGVLKMGRLLAEQSTDWFLWQVVTRLEVQLRQLGECGSRRTLRRTEDRRTKVLIRVDLSFAGD